MAKALATPPVVAGMTAGAIWAVNFLVTRITGYPFLYCLLRDDASALYMAWGKVALIIAFAFTGLSVFRGRMVDVVKGVLAMTAVIELPRFVVFLVNGGGSCG